jgi:mRNA interferase MazF
LKRGEIWWASLPKRQGSAPGYGRPVLVIQSNAFNASRIATVIVAAITTDLRLEKMPGNVLLSKMASGLPKKSVVNVSQIVTIDRSILRIRIGALSKDMMREVDEGVGLVLGLDTLGS